MHTTETELASHACYLKEMGLEVRLMDKMQSLFDSFWKETRLKRMRCEAGVDVFWMYLLDCRAACDNHCRGVSAVGEENQLR